MFSIIIYSNVSKSNYVSNGFGTNVKSHCIGLSFSLNGSKIFHHDSGKRNVFKNA